MKSFRSRKMNTRANSARGRNKILSISVYMHMRPECLIDTRRAEHTTSERISDPAVGRRDSRPYVDESIDTLPGRTVIRAGRRIFRSRLLLSCQCKSSEQSPSIRRSHNTKFQQQASLQAGIRLLRRRWLAYNWGFRERVDCVVTEPARLQRSVAGSRLVVRRMQRILRDQGRTAAVATAERHRSGADESDDRRAARRGLDGIGWRRVPEVKFTTQIDRCRC